MVCGLPPALLPAILYFSWLLPQRSPGEIQGDQLNSALITDASSNGLVEVGFAYPIYTPLISSEIPGCLPSMSMYFSE